MDVNCPNCSGAMTAQALDAQPTLRPVETDPDGVAKALHDLAAGVTQTSPTDSAKTSSALSDAQIDAIFDVARVRESEGTSDLVAIGAAAIGGLLGALMFSR